MIQAIILLEPIIEKLRIRVLIWVSNISCPISLVECYCISLCRVVLINNRDCSHYIVYIQLNDQSFHIQILFR